MEDLSRQPRPPIPVSAISLCTDAVHLDLAPLNEIETEKCVKSLIGIKDNNIRISEELLNVVNDQKNGCPVFIKCITLFTHTISSKVSSESATHLDYLRTYI